MIRLRLLGGASLSGPDGPLAGRAAQRRRVALLALLALARKPVARDKLIAWLWPESDTTSARRLLSEALYVVRRDVDERAIEALGDQLRLDPDRVACDAVEFEDALARGDAAAAVDLYDGPFLDGFFVNDAEEFERWAAAERDRLERRYREALEQLAVEAARRGDARAASSWWRRLAAQDPLDGRVALALMNALVAAGDRAGALQHARVHESLLREEHGLAPDAAVLQLTERLRSGEAAAVAVAPPGPAAVLLVEAPLAAAPAAPGPGSERARRVSAARSDQLRAELKAALAPDFEIGRLVGTGSTAHVFLAHDVALDKAVTVKVLNPELAATAEGRVRFERAARAAANVEHPNVVGVHRFGVLPAGEPFVVMRYVHGRTLEKRLAAEGAMSSAEVRRIAADVADALAAAHAAGVVHRDVRPDNILLDEASGRALLTDFGLAGMTEVWGHTPTPRITRTGQVLGDERYLSPEQRAGRYVTETTDVYALAVVAIEMLTAHSPAEGERLDVATARVRGEAPEVPAALEEDDPALALWLRRCLNPVAEARPSARNLAERLRETPGGGGPPDYRFEWVPAAIRAAWRALAHRRVPQWVAAVATAGIVVIGITSDSRDYLPAAAFPMVVSTAIAAVVAASVLAWFHGAHGEQRFRATELALLSAIAAAWIASLVAILS